MVKRQVQLQVNIINGQVVEKICIIEDYVFCEKEKA